MRCRVCDKDGLVGLGRVDGYAFFECPTCGFAFTPDVTQGDADGMYREPMGDAPEHGWANPEFLEPSLERLGPGPQRILDFGTGRSGLPHALRRRGHRVIAVDTVAPDEPHPDRLTGSLFDVDLATDEFDLCFAFQVFEHLPQPRAQFEELVRVTRPGGVVVIHTDMHVAERDAGAFTDWWYVMPPIHCSFYRHRTFEWLVGGTPHRVIDAAPKWVAVEKRRPASGHAAGAPRS